MLILTSAPHKGPSSRQLSTAAGNIAAAQFAMYGFDILEQGPQARYAYDLGVANSCGMMKVAVHGSFRGFWNIVDPLASNLTRADYHRAIDRWLKHQGPRVTFCLVQFEAADLRCMPRLYLATAAEIATRLHTSVEQLGDIALYEEFELEDESGHHSVETLPAQWKFSEQRIAELMTSDDRLSLGFRFSAAAEGAACAPAQSASGAHPVPMMN